MSGMGVALAVVVTYSSIFSSHPPVENHRDILQVEARYHPPIRHLCGPYPGQTRGIVRLTVCVGSGSDRDHNHLE